MKLFFGWWRDAPQLRVHFVRPSKETDPLAERAIESLHQATDNLQQAVSSVQRALALVDNLQTQLTRVRSELAAYAAGSMDDDLQIAELERMRLKDTPQKEV